MSRSDAFDGRRRRLLAVRRLLSRVDVRVALSVCIIVSLLPFEWVHRFDIPFFFLFGAEFVARVTLVFRGRWVEDGRVDEDDDDISLRMPGLGRSVLLLFDFLALISFMPWGLFGLEARWLRVFRLTRMLLLVGYWAPLVRDLWSVLIRRERAKQLVLMGVVVGGLSFAGAVVLDHIAASDSLADFDGDGTSSGSDRKFLVRLWWAFRQLQDPGNMVQSPESVAAVAVSVALTVVGLFLVSFLIGLGTDVVRELMEV